MNQSLHLAGISRAESEADPTMVRGRPHAGDFKRMGFARSTLMMAFMITKHWHYRIMIPWAPYLND
jgi:hypothetical protein